MIAHVIIVYVLTAMSITSCVVSFKRITVPLNLALIPLMVVDRGLIDSSTNATKPLAESPKSDVYSTRSSKYLMNHGSYLNNDRIPNMAPDLISCKFLVLHLCDSSCIVWCYSISSIEYRPISGNIIIFVIVTRPSQKILFTVSLRSKIT